MFESVSENLTLLSYFAVIGFFLGALYEIIRIIRLFKRQNALTVGITDFLFLCFAAVVAFAYSMEFGSGRFRWFYVFGLIFGGAVYFLTVGRVVSLASNLIVKCVKRLLVLIIKYIFVPLCGLIVILGKKSCAILRFFALKFVKVYNFTQKRAINSSKHLQSKVKMLYNEKVAKRAEKRTQTKKAGRNYQNKNFAAKTAIAGENRNVVKGKIRGKVTVTSARAIGNRGEKA